MYKKSNNKENDPSHSGEAGFTLIEVIIVIVLTAILGGFGFSALTQTVKTQADFQVKKEKSDDTVLTMEKMCRELRTAIAGNITIGAENDDIGFEILNPPVGGVPSVNGYVLYARNGDSIVRLSMESSDDNGADYGDLTTDLANDEGDIIAESITGFTVNLIGTDEVTISMQFDGDTENRQTSVFIRN